MINWPRATVTGMVRTSGTATLVSLTLTGTGAGTIFVSASSTHATTFTGKMTLNGELGDTNGSLVVTGGSTLFRIKDLVTRKTSTTPTASRKLTSGDLALPEDVTGDWELTLDLTANKSRYTGKALVQTLPLPGTLTALTASGIMSKTGLLTLTIRGSGASLSLGTTLTGSNSMTVQKLKGTLFGQKLNFPAP